MQDWSRGASSTQFFAVVLSLCLAPLLAGCGKGSATSPTAVAPPTSTTLAGTAWSGPFADSSLGAGTMTLTFGAGEDATGAAGTWSLRMADLTTAGALRMLPRPATDPADAVTLGLATALLDRNCDMLLNARVNGSQMQGTLKIGRCEAQGEHVADITLARR